MMNLKPYVCRDYNRTFFKSTECVVFTLFYAIFSNVGPSAKNPDWSCKIPFHGFLKSKGEEINRFFDPLSARFGKDVEMGIPISTSFHDHFLQL